MKTVSEEIAIGMARAELLTTEDQKAEMLEAIKAVAKEKGPEAIPFANATHVLHRMIEREEDNRGQRGGPGVHGSRWL
jgi:hypothetical protein